MCESRKPKFVAELRKSLYVDDLVTGDTTVTQGTTEIFHDATFTLYKWHSNAPDLVEEATNTTGEQKFAKQQLGVEETAVFLGSLETKVLTRQEISYHL